MKKNIYNSLKELLLEADKDKKQREAKLPVGTFDAADSLIMSILFMQNKK